MEKASLLAHLRTLLDERVEMARSAMQAAQESANAESKSSAGDKYETARAMAQNERDQHARQYETARLDRLQLERPELTGESDSIAFGSLVRTAGEWFFLAVSVGVVRWEGDTVLVISPGSPVAGQLLGKKAGDTFLFKGKQTAILGIY